jgi:hypothetical protein
VAAAASPCAAIGAAAEFMASGGVEAGGSEVRCSCAAKGAAVSVTAARASSACPLLCSMSCEVSARLFKSVRRGCRADRELKRGGAQQCRPTKDTHRASPLPSFLVSMSGRPFLHLYCLASSRRRTFFFCGRAEIWPPQQHERQPAVAPLHPLPKLSSRRSCSDSRLACVLDLTGFRSRRKSCRKRCHVNAVMFEGGRPSKRVCQNEPSVRFSSHWKGCC